MEAERDIPDACYPETPCWRDKECEQSYANRPGRTLYNEGICKRGDNELFSLAVEDQPALNVTKVECLSARSLANLTIKVRSTYPIRISMIRSTIVLAWSNRASSTVTTMMEKGGAWWPVRR